VFADSTQVSVHCGHENTTDAVLSFESGEPGVIVRLTREFVDLNSFRVATQRAAILIARLTSSH